MPRRALDPDLTLATVARALGFERAPDFEARLGDYLRRGFPPPDPITGRVDPEAFSRWRRLRTPHLFPELTASPATSNASIDFDSRLEAFVNGNG